MVVGMEGMFSEGVGDFDFDLWDTRGSGVGDFDFDLWDVEGSGVGDLDGIPARGVLVNTSRANCRILFSFLFRIACAASNDSVADNECLVRWRRGVYPLVSMKLRSNLV